MKKFTAVAASLLFVGSIAMANDTKNNVEHTTDTSKNPITGTETTTDKYQKDVKMADGSTAKVNIKKKTKKYKDGSVKKTTDAEAESESQVK